MKESVAKIAAVYEKAGVKNLFAGRFYDVPHRFTGPCRTRRSMVSGDGKVLEVTSGEEW